MIGDKLETEVLFRDDYDPARIITSDTLINSTGETLEVLFAPWHGGGAAYERLAMRHAARGDAVLSFNFDDQLLTYDSDQVLKSFRALSETAAERINKLASTGAYRDVNLTAASLGTSALTMTAPLLNRFDRIRLVTPGANVADCTWHGIRTKHIKYELEKRGETYDSLNDKWQPIAPVTHVAALVGKEVELVLSRTDKIIPTRSQYEYASAVRAQGIQPKVSYRFGGHYWTIGRYCYTGAL